MYRGYEGGEVIGVDIYERVAGWVERKSGCVDRGARECAEDVVAFLAPFGSPVSGVSCFGNSAQRGDVGSPGRTFDPPGEVVDGWGSWVSYLLRYCSSFEGAFVGTSTL